MAIVRNRECCYWKKPDCAWEHCREVTLNALGGRFGKIILKHKICGNLAAERFRRKIARKNIDTTNAVTALFDFIKKGSDVLNSMKH